MSKTNLDEEQKARLNVFTTSTGDQMNNFEIFYQIALITDLLNAKSRFPKAQIQSTTEEFQFVKDEVNVIIHECIENVLGNEKWDGSKQEQWNNLIMEGILEKMSILKKPYKYIVQCTSVQRAGGAVDVANACFWDLTSDGSCTVRWENEHIYVIVSVFGIFI